MPASFSVVLQETHAREIRRLAWENDLREGEVLRQLVEIGLTELEAEPRI